jgi:hypothetical protein
MNKWLSYIFNLLITVSIIFTLLGCSGSSIYVREDQVTKTITYSDTDLKLMAEKMVTSLLETDILKGRPIIWISDVQNNTSEYIDTQGILDKISVALLKSGRIRLVDRQALDKLAKEKMLVDYKRIDVQDAVKIGKVIGADYVLLGNLMSIQQKDKGFFTENKLVYYKFTMRLIGMDSEIIWMDEKELKKATNSDKFF